MVSAAQALGFGSCVSGARIDSLVLSREWGNGSL